MVLIEGFLLISSPSLIIVLDWPGEELLRDILEEHKALRFGGGEAEFLFDFLLSL